MRILLAGLLTALLATACASIGSPDGGPRDELPPVFLRSNPMPGATNVDRPRIDLYFNENIKLDNVADKLVVSPAQSQSPQVSSNGRHISVALRDTLLPNTTYTLDFSDAVRDLNEGNILDGFALDFSTGPDIDTLKISGKLFEARNLEPAQGMVVGVYSNLSDTAITTIPLERVAKTNQNGEFTIRGLKPGLYRLFAIDDRNHDWHWDRSENVAFATLNISPQVDPVEIADTLRAADGSDSIAIRTGFRYLPDDVLLTWFNENYRSQYLRDNERTDRRRLTFKFGAPLDSMPSFTIASGPRAGRNLADLALLETRAERDSLVYWFTDSALIATDSLLVEARYQKTDSLDQLAFATDTLKLFYRPPRAPDKKKLEADIDTLPPPIPLLNLSMITSSTQELNLPVTFESETPVAAIDTAAIRLEMKVDTLWQPVAGMSLRRDSLLLRRYHIAVPAWLDGLRYRLTIDSLAVTDVYGLWNKTFTHEFTTKRREDYGNIIFHITDLHQLIDSTSAQLMVELLNSQDKPQQTVAADPASGIARFTYVAPGTYYARAWVDANANGQWDTGRLLDRVQPEDVYYYPKSLKLKKNWDIDQDWALEETPVDLQKPDEIKKNRPRGASSNGAPGNRPSDDSDDSDDEADSDTYYEQGAWGNGSQYNNARRGSQGNAPSSSRPGLQRARGHM